MNAETKALIEGIRKNLEGWTKVQEDTRAKIIELQAELAWRQETIDEVKESLAKLERGEVAA